MAAVLALGALRRDSFPIAGAASVFDPPKKKKKKKTNHFPYQRRDTNAWRPAMFWVTGKCSHVESVDSPGINVLLSGQQKFRPFPFRLLVIRMRALATVWDVLWLFPPRSPSPLLSVLSAGRLRFRGCLLAFIFLTGQLFRPSPSFYHVRPSDCCSSDEIASARKIAKRRSTLPKRSRLQG